MQLAQPGAQPQQSASQLFRASDGKMRVDYGNTSVITNPAAQQSIILDHVKQEARVIPLPQMPKAPGMPRAPGMPAAPGAPTPPPMTAVDLGKGFIEGHEVSGKQYTFPMPKLPPAPGMPQAPGAPQAPGMPKLPGMPQAPAMPKAPPMPTVAEVWTSTSLHLPVLTKITGSFGQRTCYCKNTPTGEPHPTVFQIPPGYKLAT